MILKISGDEIKKRKMIMTYMNIPYTIRTPVNEIIWGGFLKILVIPVKNFKRNYYF